MLKRSCNDSKASTNRVVRASEGRNHRAAPNATSKHAIPLPVAQYVAATHGSRCATSSTKHASISPTMVPLTVQLSTCCNINRLRQGCRAAINCSLLLPGMLERTFSWLEGAALAMPLIPSFFRLLLPLYPLTVSFPSIARGDQ